MSESMNERSNATDYQGNEIHYLVYRMNELRGICDHEYLLKEADAYRDDPDYLIRLVSGRCIIVATDDPTDRVEFVRL